MEANEREELFKKMREVIGTPEYEAYHKAVVEEGIERTDESMRLFWESASYEMEFVEGESVDDCVTGNIEAMEGE
jgi:hypothetical protein